MADMEQVNPYQAPAPGFSSELEYTGASHFELAEAGTRLVGAILDGLLFVVAVIPGAALQIIVGDESDYSTVALVLMGVCAIGMACIQWFLIATTGQSIAKRLLKIRIVRTNGAPVGFVHGSRSPMPVAASTDAADRIPGAWVEIVDGAGHFVWVEAPGAIRTALRRLTRA